MEGLAKTPWKTKTPGKRTEGVNKIRQRDARFKLPNGRKTRHTNGKRNTCRFCCGDHILKKEKCPALGRKFLNCGGRNHFAKASRKSKKSHRSDAAVKQIETTIEETFDSDSNEVDFITSISTTANSVNSESPSYKAPNFCSLRFVLLSAFVVIEKAGDSRLLQAQTLYVREPGFLSHVPSLMS